MIGFEPRTSGFGSGRSANLATTTAHEVIFIITSIGIGGVVPYDWKMNSKWNASGKYETR